MKDVETRGSGTPILPLNAACVKESTPLIEPVNACVFHVSPSTAVPAIHDFPNIHVFRSNFFAKKLGPTGAVTQPFWIAPNTSLRWLGIQMSAIAFFVWISVFTCVWSTESTFRLTVTEMP